jgi:O-acetyl-ADP-ribose deacetylase (regulator of RNase III)
MRFELGKGKRIELTLGDITAESTDAIVNAANSSLMGGGGVDGAIHRAAGPAILDECRAIVKKQGYLEDGQAVVTSAGRLKAKYIIHTAGPVFEDGTHGEPDHLASCYRESVKLADSLDLKSMAFPSISTGIFAYPLELAAPIALSSVGDALVASKSVATARFVLFDDRTFAAYRVAAEAKWTTELENAK